VGNVGLQNVNVSGIDGGQILHTVWSGLSGLTPSQHLQNSKPSISSYVLTSSLGKICLGTDTTCTVSLRKLDCVYAPAGWLRVTSGTVRVRPVDAEASEACDFWRRLRIGAA